MRLAQRTQHSVPALLFRTYGATPGYVRRPVIAKPVMGAARYPRMGDTMPDPPGESSEAGPLPSVLRHRHRPDIGNRLAGLAPMPDAKEPQYLAPAPHECAVREEGRKEGNRQHILGNDVEPADMG